MSNQHNYCTTKGLLPAFLIITFFIVGVMKSFYIFLVNDKKK